MRRIILDTDLGMGALGTDMDDGFALALALADPEMTVELVTTVNGNADVDTATRLTLDLLETLGHADVPVARGAAHPLTRYWSRGPADAAPFYPPGTDHTGRVAGHAAIRIVERVMAEPGRLTLVAIGPLTNVALALHLEPRIASSVEEIVVMGGVFLGHTNVAAMPGEFNMWADPEAAEVVLGSGAPISFVGLDVTRQVRLTREQARELAEGGTAFGKVAAESTLAWIDHLERTSPGDERERGSCAMHDPVAVAVVSNPELVTWRPARVAVETAGERTRGMAVADLLFTADPPPANCRIATAVEVQGFLDVFFERLRSLP